MMKHPFIKHVLTLMKGTTIAQLIPIIISPLLTRMFTPEQFGVFAIYIAVISVLAPIVNGRYELAIALPKDNRKSLSIFALSFLINVFVTCFTILIIVFGSKNIAEIFMLENTNWLYLLPLGVFLIGMLSSYLYMNNRQQQFRNLANAKMVQSISMAITQLVFGVLKYGYIGLVLGYCIGQISSIAVMARSAPVFRQLKDENIQRNDIKTVAQEYKDFPKYAMVTHSTESLATNIPNILLSKFFGAQFTGFYSLTTRTIAIPLSFIGNAVGDVFLSTASKLYREHGNCEDLFKKTFITLVLIPIIPLLILFAFAEDIFTVVFGEDWAIAGKYTKILIPALYLQFISSPLSHMFVIAKKVKIEFFIQISILIASFTSFLVGYFYFHSSTVSLILFSVVLVLKYSLFIYLSYRFAKNQANKRKMKGN